MDPEDLAIVGIVAFDGATKNGLRVHPDGKHLVYPMGRKITVRNTESGEQRFLSGHSNAVTALCLSECGKFVASGQSTHLGFKATVIIWEYESGKIRGSHEIHKVSIEDLCFSGESNFLVSLGGRDDGKLVVWDVANNEAICGCDASNETRGDALTIARTNLRDRCFLTGGQTTLKVWQIDPETRKISGLEVKVGKLGRTVGCIVLDTRDEMAYCGTTTGDLLKARLNYSHDTEKTEPAQPPVLVGCYSKIPKSLKKLKAGEGDLYRGGIRSILFLDEDKLIVGAGDGTLELVEIVDEPLDFSQKSVKSPTTPRLRARMTEHVPSAVTSMSFLEPDAILVGTAACEIYRIGLRDFAASLVVACHGNAIYDVAFPRSSSQVFATASKNDVRLWHLRSQRELSRMTVSNFICASLCFSADGKIIFTAWNDGIVRAFESTSGELTFSIANAHVKAVSAICVTSDSGKLVTGGCDGQIRLWSLSASTQRLESVLKEHRGPVTSLDVSFNDTEVVSSSTDGTCIVWDVERCSRKRILMGNTMFTAARFAPNGLQILTCGTDRGIAYWETLDGSLIRRVEGSSAGGLECLDVSPDGRFFVTGSSDCLVKLWDYRRGETTRLGVGHAAIITACRFSPDGEYIVTVSGDGAVFVWKCPFAARFEQPPSARSRSTCSLREEQWARLSTRESLGDRRGSVASPSSGSRGTADSVRATLPDSKSSRDRRDYDPAESSLRGACRCSTDDEREVSRKDIAAADDDNDDRASAAESGSSSSRTRASVRSGRSEGTSSRVSSDREVPEASAKTRKSSSMRHLCIPPCVDELNASEDSERGSLTKQSSIRR